ncbi:MAG: hypothetical protein HYX78_14085 [Armatimonadetes bacterium]|nr:hypothetical protein [Armatimonadota bacterium]
MLLDILEGWGNSAMYLAADAPEAALPGWWELQWRRVGDLARRGKSVLLLDEIQYLPKWSRLVKTVVDQVYQENLPLHIVITGDYTSRDLIGLLEFVRRFPDFRAMILCDDRYTDTARRIGIDAVPWREFLWSGPV